MPNVEPELVAAIGRLSERQRVCVVLVHGFGYRNREVADLLGLSVATLRAWRHRGQGPRFLRLGRAVRYLPADLEDFVRASAVDASQEPSSDQTGIEELRS
jgi:predicted DNA-binding transcriptional regulator AlpA